jgi:hypothetical protein
MDLPTLESTGPCVLLNFDRHCVFLPIWLGTVDLGLDTPVHPFVL